MPAYFPILLGAHIILAVSLILPSILLPFALRTRRATVESENRAVQGLLWAQTHGTIAIGIGLALTGLGLVASLGSSLLQQPWLLLALDDLLRSTSASRSSSSVRTCAGSSGLRAADDDKTWLERAKRQRYVSYLMAGLVGDDRLPDELEAGALVTADARTGSTAGSVDLDCLFCKIAAGTIPADRLHDDDLVVAFRDIAPRAPTHILLIPRRHIASAADLTDADAPMLGRLFAVAAELARERRDRRGRLPPRVERGAWGGQTVDHFHVHLMGGRPFDWPPG